MAKFLIDENLPAKFSLWNSPEFIHVDQLGISISDLSIWNYAQQNELIIVTKDADFYNLALGSDTHVKVVQLKIGNMRMRDLHNFLHSNWPTIDNMIQKSQLLLIYSDRIESIK